MTQPRNKVAVCRIELLPGSETFIVDQFNSYSSWSALLFGKRRVIGLDVSALRPFFLGLVGPGVLKGIYERILRRFQLPDVVSAWQIWRSGSKLVHVHFATDAVELWPTLKWLGLPILITLHGYDITIRREFWEQGLGGHARKLYPKTLLRLSQSPKVRFVAVSQAIKDRAVEFGIPADSVFVRYIGIDLSRFPAPPLPLSSRSKRILFVGRLVEKKGVIYLIQAFRLVLEKVPEAELVIIGDGPLRRELELLAKDLGSSVRFLGFLTQREVNEQLNSSRLFCLASIRASNGDAEGLPIVLLECQAAGVPAITSAHGGSTEAIIDQVTGVAFPETDSSALASALSNLLIDDARLDRMSSAARSFVQSQFDIVDCTAKLEGLYSEFLQGFRPTKAKGASGD